MEANQIVLLLSAAIVLVLVRRWLLNRGVHQYSPAEVADRIRRPSGSVLLDVRTLEERQRYCIKGSLHIPLHELGSRVEELSPHRSKEVICYCQSGHRSIAAAGRLKKQGFAVAHMKGGIAEWNSVGLR